MILDLNQINNFIAVERIKSADIDLINKPPKFDKNYYQYKSFSYS
ncbi:hypothetical protein BROOK1789B_890 [Bathymodiolus brooksi thiotrophic gill symbiont]|nr:hypothetical protein BROOK1789B_890 [Bathymodiolus brooksi thiotrophic gill symbiont]